MSRLHSFSGAALLTLTLLLSAALPSAAQAQRVEWRGFAYLYDFTAACAANGWVGRAQSNVRFRPSGLGSNGEISRLAFFDTFYAFGLALPGRRFDGRWRAVQADAIGSGAFPWPDVQMRIRSQSPNNNNLSETSPQVRIVGQIRNFDEVAGCTATFDATMILRR